MAAQVNDLVGALNYARSEAVSRGQRVYLCQSTDETHCTDGSNWSDGWIVYSPDPTAAGVSPASDNIIRVEDGSSGQVQISRSNGLPAHVSFNADGFALGSQGDFTFHTNSSVPDRTVEIEPSGVISSSVE
ncbi:type-4 fimbrial pilin related signal peptide protein [Salinisphaera hydrothermalis C27AD]